jgi:cell division septum initiation protein DivIVA
MKPDEVIHILNEGEYPGYYDEVAAVDCVKNLVKENEELKKEIEQLKSKVQYWKGRVER